MCVRALTTFFDRRLGTYCMWGSPGDVSGGPRHGLEGPLGGPF